MRLHEKCAFPSMFINSVSFQVVWQATVLSSCQTRQLCGRWKAYPVPEQLVPVVLSKGDCAALRNDVDH